MLTWGEFYHIYLKLKQSSYFLQVEHDLKYPEEKARPGLEQYLEEFIQDRFDELVQVKESLANEEYDKIASIGHKWKGFCEPYGFHTLELLSKDLELVAKSCDAEKVTAHIEKIERYLSDKRDDLLS